MSDFWHAAGHAKVDATLPTVGDRGIHTQQNPCGSMGQQAQGL